MTTTLGQLLGGLAAHMGLDTPEGRAAVAERSARMNARRSHSALTPEQRERRNATDRARRARHRAERERRAS
jgi:hypothetical protein